MSLREAKIRAQEGMERAASNADRSTPDWSVTAFAACVRAIRKMPPMFTFEQLRLAAGDIEQPPDLRAWGIIAKRLVETEYIQRTGRYAPTASSNCAPKMLYQRLTR